MHSLLKPEVPRLSSLSSHICKNKGEAGGGTADLESRLAFLSGVNASPKQEQFPCCPWLPGISQGCLQSAGERDTGAEENHGLIFPNILLLQEWWQLEIVLCYHDYCLKDMDRFVWGRGNFSSEIFYSPESPARSHSNKGSDPISAPFWLSSQICGGRISGPWVTGHMYLEKPL